MKCRIPEQEAAGKLNGNIQMTAYDLNKQLILSLGPIKDEELNKFRSDFAGYIREIEDKFFMLLCKEQSYYTIFNYTSRNDSYYFADVLLEVIEAVGSFYNYSIDEENGGVELWIKPEDKEEVFVYYFFPYDAGVVEV